MSAADDSGAGGNTAVTQAEAERVLFASSNGELAFGLLNNDSTVAVSGGVNPSNLFR